MLTIANKRGGGGGLGNKNKFGNMLYVNSPIS